MNAPRDNIALLEMSSVSKSFPGVKALENVSLELFAGQVHGLIGQNGAGKSTLINILSGMLGPDSGEIRLSGASVVMRGTRHALELGIATVYQELSLLPNLTVAENLALGREPKKFKLLSVREMAANSERALARLRLELRPDALVSSLPLAQRQMIEIAKALATDPKILVLDEPTAPLGYSESQQLFEAIERLRSEGVCIVYVSHRFAEVLALCDVATILRNGRKIETSPIKGWTEARLTEAMIGSQTEKYVPSNRDVGSQRIAISNLSYGQQVRGANLEVRAGEIVVLAGLLGAGQNEIARMLGGDLSPTSGQIKKDGVGIALRKPGDAKSQRIAILTEDRKHEGILPNLSLLENIAIASLSARSSGFGVIRGREERRQVEATAGKYDVVAASLDVPIRTLSGGNQQKALIARWDLADADVVILIEPTRGVDVGARADIYRRLDELTQASKAVLVVTSDLPEALTLADRILVVKSGSIIAEVSPDAVTEEKLNLLIQGVSEQ